MPLFQLLACQLKYMYRVLLALSLLPRMLPPQLIENANGIFKIEKMNRIRPGMAEMQAKTSGRRFIARVSCLAYVLYMNAEMDRRKCLRDVFRCIFAMPGPILFIFSFFYIPVCISKSYILYFFLF